MDSTYIVFGLIISSIALLLWWLLLWKPNHGSLAPSHRDSLAPSHRDSLAPSHRDSLAPSPRAYCCRENKKDKVLKGCSAYRDKRSCLSRYQDDQMLPHSRPGCHQGAQTLSLCVWNSLTGQCTVNSKQCNCNMAAVGDFNEALEKCPYSSTFQGRPLCEVSPADLDGKVTGFCISAPPQTSPAASPSAKL